MSADGSCYTWGSNASGRLGYKTDTFQSIPKKVEILRNKVQLYLGPDIHTPALTKWLGRLNLLHLQDALIDIGVRNLDHLVKLNIGRKSFTTNIIIRSQFNDLFGQAKT